MNPIIDHMIDNWVFVMKLTYEERLLVIQAVDQNGYLQEYLPDR